MVFSVLEMKLTYYDVLLMALKRPTVLIMRLLELVVVIPHLIHCDRYSICVRMDVVMIFLLALPCTESDVRLLNNQLQICHNEVWGYVCGDFDWTNDDASVVCRELGFSPEGRI